MTKVLLLSLKQHDLVGKKTYPVGQVPSLIAEPGVYTMHMHGTFHLPTHYSMLNDKILD